MPKGGFICEEMGLGKTIEVLGLVLANPAPKDWLKNGDPEGTVCRSPSEGLGMRAETNSSGQAMDARLATKYRSTATLVVCAVSLVSKVIVWGLGGTVSAFVWLWAFVLAKQSFS